jgi:uncharacterized protein (DUF885 family)
MADINNTQDDTQIIDDVETTQDDTHIDEPTVDEPKESSVITTLRKKQREDARKVKELQAQLDKINKEKSDKDKSLEEKLAQAEADRAKREEELNNYRKKTQLEKSLLISGVDSKLAELLIDRAVDNVDDDYSNITEVIDELKTDYPQLFVEKPKPVGKVGTPVVGSSKSSKYTKEEVEKLLRDPNTPLTDELDKIARGYGL